MLCCSKPKSWGKMGRRLIISDSVEKVITELENVISVYATQSIKHSDLFKIGLSGGSLIKFLCECLPKISTDWTKWRFFFCDERVVGFDDKESTFGCYKRDLLDKIPVKEDQFVVINPDLPVEATAVDYTEKLKQYFKTDQLPQFDLLLLGLGPDGHTCSLFPGHKLLNETEKWVAPISDSPKPPPCRVTLTLPVVNNAKCAVFAATGSGKAEVLKRVFDETDPDPLPAARVQPHSGNLIWIIDQEAAKLLVNP